MYMFHKRLLREFKENRKYTWGIVFSQWVSLAANIIFMLTVSSYIARLVTQRLTAQWNIRLAITLAGVLAVRGLASYAADSMSFQASDTVKKRLREMIYNKLFELGTGYREHFPTSEAVQISTEGVEQLEIYFGKYVPQFFYSLLAPVTLFSVTAFMSIKAALILLLCVPLIPLSIAAVQKFAKKLLKKYWGTYTHLGDSFLECLQGLTTLKIYQADSRYADKIDEEAEIFRKVTMKVLIMQLNSISVMDLAAYGGAAAGMIVSILEFRAGSISLMECFFIVMISAEFFLPLRLLGSFFHIAMNGNAAADKIFRLLDLEVPEKGTVKKLKNSAVSFENVTFGYEEGQPVICNVNLHIPDKGFTAVTGASGSGKSTLASLIMGEYRDYQGRILVGGVEVRNMDEAALYRSVTRVGHDSCLFGGTAAGNLRMGNEKASDEELLEVLKQVDLYDTVMEKGGLAMEVREKGANLSGGQRQRLAMARAILHDSDIYIFDEAASNVDAESEDRMMGVIRKLARKKTVILISHRLANVTEADQILVVSGKGIMEQGNHRALMAEKGIYHNLYTSQKKLEQYAKMEEAV